MNESTIERDRIEEEAVFSDVSDEALEVAASGTRMSIWPVPGETFIKCGA